MTCQELAEILIDYVAGELAQERSDSLRDHLAACPHCVHFVESYQITIQLTRRLPAAPLPAELIERMQRAIEEKPS